MFSRKAQEHTFQSFCFIFSISLKEDVILLTQQILFPFLEGKAEQMMSYLHPFTKLSVYLSICMLLVLNKNFF